MSHLYHRNVVAQDNLSESHHNTILFNVSRLKDIPVLFMGFILILVNLMGCTWNLDVIDYGPMPGEDWEISTPVEQSLDSTLVSELYFNAAKVETIYSLLVVKNGYLIAEKYFHEGSVDQKARLQSATKSFTSALVGIALYQGYLTSVDQKMMEFFPELADDIKDPRKNDITIQQLLQMRAGYPWEESTDELFELLYTGFRPSTLVDVPLVRNPGSRMQYSNLSSHLLAIIVARAAETDLKSFATEHLFTPLNIEPGEWITDWEGYYNGHGDLYLTARDMAKFGLLYMNNGVYNGERILPADWVEASLQTYSNDAWPYRIGRNYQDIGYCYQWWSARAGDHRFNFAWGHGGQQITLVDDLNMVIVVTADPLWGEHGGGPWRKEKANLNLVADFVNSLPDR